MLCTIAQAFLTECGTKWGTVATCRLQVSADTPLTALPVPPTAPGQDSATGKGLPAYGGARVRDPNGRDGYKGEGVLPRPTPDDGKFRNPRVSENHCCGLV